MAYHNDLPQSWISIIEEDFVLNEIWANHNSQYEAVPEFLFGSIWDEIERVQPIFALYGKAGITMYDRILELKALIDHKEAQESLEKYKGYFYVKEKRNKVIVQDVVKKYIKAMNDFYINELEEEAILDEDAKITFVASEERTKIIEAIQKDWQEENNLPENELYEVIGDWYIQDIPIKSGCEELKDLLWESLYNIEEDYKMSYYLLWFLTDRPEKDNPYLPYYMLWCMGYTAKFVARDEVLLCSRL